MIYTLGKTEIYDKYIREDPDPRKLGRGLDHSGNPYQGRSVWRTREEAQAHLDRYPGSGFSVYGVLADWDTETALNPEGDWHDLLVSAQLVMLP